LARGAAADGLFLRCRAAILPDAMQHLAKACAGQLHSLTVLTAKELAISAVSAVP
jgi:hypothetical protein